MDVIKIFAAKYLEGKVVVLKCGITARISGYTLDSDLTPKQLNLQYDKGGRSVSCTWNDIAIIKDGGNGSQPRTIRWIHPDISLSKFRQLK